MTERLPLPDPWGFIFFCLLLLGVYYGIVRLMRSHNEVKPIPDPK